MHWCDINTYWSKKECRLQTSGYVIRRNITHKLSCLKGFQMYMYTLLHMYIMGLSAPSQYKRVPYSYQTTQQKDSVWQFLSCTQAESTMYACMSACLQLRKLPYYGWTNWTAQVYIFPPWNWAVLSCMLMEVIKVRQVLYNLQFWGEQKR